MLKIQMLWFTTLFGGSIKVADYFISVLEAPALNMGVFVGIISGFVATAYNKYYNFRKLPDALSFFNGKRFCTICSYSSFSNRCNSTLLPSGQ